MFRRILAIALITNLATIPGVAQEIDVGACLATATVEDEANDEFHWPLEGGNAIPHPALDLLDYTVTDLGTHLHLSLRIAERPPDDATESYRYWVGFAFLMPDGTQHRMDARIAFTTAYDEAVIVGPNAWSNPSLERVSVTWNGPTMQMLANKTKVYEMAGTNDLVFGMPYASSDGAHRTTQVQGAMTAVPYTMDFLGDRTDFKPLQRCKDSPAGDLGPAGHPNASGQEAMPGPGILAVMVAFVTAGCVLGRRQS